MQSKFAGISCIFLFHAVSMLLLCPSKYGKAKTALVWGMVVLLSVTSSFSLIRRFPTFGGGVFTFSVAVLLFAAAVLFLSRSPFYRILFLTLIYLEAFMVAVFLSGFFSSRFFGGDLDAAILIRSILQLVIVYLCAFARKKFDKISKGITDGWWPLNLLATLLLSYLTVLTLRAYSSGFSERSQCVSVFLLIVILIAVHAVFFHTIHFMYNAAEKQRAELQSQSLLQQVETMQESVQMALRIRHDIRHHNMQIQEYIQAGEYEALLRYLGQYEQNGDHTPIVTFCDNLAANSILCAYTRKAKQHGIKLRFNVNMDRDTGISDMDIVSILANLMENAICGCLRSGKDRKAIDVYIGSKMGKLVIYIRNTSDGNVDFEDGLPQSKTGGGIGVTSILHSASHYGGEYDFRDGGGYFSAQIVLELPEHKLARES